jgi:hypothetical protein
MNRKKTKKRTYGHPKTGDTNKDNIASQDREDVENMEMNNTRRQRKVMSSCGCVRLTWWSRESSRE